MGFFQKTVPVEEEIGTEAAQPLNSVAALKRVAEHDECVARVLGNFENQVSEVLERVRGGEEMAYQDAIIVREYSDLTVSALLAFGYEIPQAVFGEYFKELIEA